jgi:putative Mg2+ transporter-C (MgtC) family protein
MNEHLFFTDMLLRLAAAALGGALVGLERQLQDKPAGLRTNMLVSVGAAGFVLTAMAVTQAGAADEQQFNFDPTRILQGIVGGIGFLGAGAILHSRGNIHGITTAAAMWVVAAVGAACGFGQFRLAAAMVVACLVALYPLGYLENRLERRVPNGARHSSRNEPLEPKL